MSYSPVCVHRYSRLEYTHFIIINLCRVPVNFSTCQLRGDSCCVTNLFTKKVQQTSKKEKTDNEAADDEKEKHHHQSAAAHGILAFASFSLVLIASSVTQTPITHITCTFETNIVHFTSHSVLHCTKSFCSMSALFLFFQFPFSSSSVLHNQYSPLIQTECM